MRELPLYQSHKLVRALHIAAVEIHADGSATIAPKEEGFDRLVTRPGWADRFAGTDADPGVFVQYEDGFSSWSPSKAFVDGYLPVPLATPGTGNPSAAAHRDTAVVDGKSCEVGYFRTKTVVVEAVRFMGGSSDAAICINFLGLPESAYTLLSDGTQYLHIDRPEGPVRVEVGDWIIRGVSGALCACKPDIFDKFYEAA